MILDLELHFAGHFREAIADITRGSLVINLKVLELDNLCVELSNIKLTSLNNAGEDGGCHLTLLYVKIGNSSEVVGQLSGLVNFLQRVHGRGGESQLLFVSSKINFRGLLAVLAGLGEQLIGRRAQNLGRAFGLGGVKLGKNLLPVKIGNSADGHVGREMGRQEIVLCSARFFSSPQ